MTTPNTQEEAKKEETTENNQNPPSINSPVSSAPTPEVLALIREANERARQAAIQNEELRTQLENTRNSRREEEFVDDPQKFIEAPMTNIRKQLDETLKPVMQFISKVQARDRLGELKDQVLQNLPPAFLPARQAFFNAIDGRLRDPNNPTYQTVEDAMYRLVAEAYTELSAKGINPNAPNTPPNNVTPPPMINNAPPPPKAQPTSLRELTPQEKVVAKQWGMTDKEYLEGLGEGLAKETLHVGAR